ncbi:restriction endonuclease [Conexibacter arvalis]|uniref:Restriction system protein n=1 Tax=Conexibacter arvalis TaxID=912552 RepID=A0A840IAL5_9ACTN|nr:restriction endonuclease [Conexibacter arvalis]MBB4661876.1 restriction system protein [Conexibacter arvalis]
MAVPDFQTIMRPLLVALDDGDEHAVASIRARLAREFNLTEHDLAEELPSGRAKTFANRVGWATTYLYRCRLIERPRRSVYRIADRGREVLIAEPVRIDLRVLSQFPEFHDFRRPRTDSTKPLGDGKVEAADLDATPEERVSGAYRELRSALAEDLLDRILDQTPVFFEQLVLDVLHAMGYGGSRADAAERLGGTGDEGVDGVIREDRLGLDVIYVQAKRWSRERTVKRPDIQQFVGALHGKHAAKGVFITTSSFSRGATDYAASVNSRVILIDGKELAQLMIDYDVGVFVAERFELKKVDSDYFSPDDDGAA